MAITTASQSQLGQDTAKNSQIVTTSVRLINSGASTGPAITSVIVTDSGYNTLDDTAAATSNSYIRILGTGFQSTANVFLNGTMVPKANITFVSSSELRAVLPVSNTGNYALGVFNSNSAGALYSSSFVISTMPQWLTSATLANTAANTAFSTTLSATSDSSVTYSNTTALPAGTTLASNGYFSGTISTGVQTTYTFDVKATDGENQDNTRTFSVTVTVTQLTRLYTWGPNFSTGQLGLNLGSSGYRSSPVQIGTNTNWLNLSGFAGYAGFGTASKTDGTLWAWGQNNVGQLGNENTVYRSSPVQIGTNTNWTGPLMSNGTANFAIKTDGTLWGWGNNLNGQLGVSDRAYRSSPVQIAGTTWNKLSVSPSNGGSLAIKTDGTLWGWGVNGIGQLGLNNRIYRSSPVQVGTETNWSQVSAGLGSAAAGIKTNGTLWTWGSNGDGRTGLNIDAGYRSSPTQVGTNTNWSSVCVSTQGMLAIKTDGTLWSWGANGYGQLGRNNLTYTSSPVQVGTNTNWSTISAARGTWAAIKTDGTLWTWGQNIFGSLGLNIGQNNGYHKSSPTQVGTNTNWSKIYGAGGHWVAITSN